MLKKISIFISPVALIIIALFFLWGCSSSDVNSQRSISSGTTTGFGSSGGAAVQITVTPASNPIGSGATTTLTVTVTDAQGRRTDATITLTSSGGGTFNGTPTTFSANTLGGSLIVTYTPSATGSIEIVATVNGTAIRASVTLSVV